ncbi:MAG: hypothetical protein IBJ03_16595 [Gemmatimonadaceae bacterium]|nr:hypothetical protein [Gemmatimonadaceae bacterium]
MSITRIAAAVALVLTAAASFAVSPIGAQAAEGDIVSTACQSGTVNECGSEPTQKSCSFEFSFNKNPGSIFGFSISFSNCTYAGERKLYKDFRRGQSAGACVAHPVVPADNTRTPDEYDEVLSEC